MAAQVLAQEVGTLLRERGLTIATAESCTGGAIAAAITAIPGASDYFPGGVVSYSATIKEQLLGVSPAIIADVGVVSEECAVAMAEGVRALFGATLGVATTGTAGPSGAEPGKPVGTVFLALAWAGGVACRRRVYPGERAVVIAAATEEALALALAWLQGAL